MYIPIRQLNTSVPAQHSVNRLKNNKFQKNSLGKVNLQSFEFTGKNSSLGIAGYFTIISSVLLIQSSASLFNTVAVFSLASITGPITMRIVPGFLIKNPRGQ